ncbi:MAG: hypothetical protein ACR2JB_20865, partial [Bryobacteraceae bacterium]
RPSSDYVEHMVMTAFAVVMDLLQSPSLPHTGGCARLPGNERVKLEQALEIGDIDLYCVRCDQHWKATAEDISNLKKC